jgi:hypothetical protein
MLLSLVSLMHATFFCLFGAYKTLFTGFSLACLIAGWLSIGDMPKLEDVTVELLIELHGCPFFVGTVFLCLTAGVNIWALLLIILKFWFVSFSLRSLISSMSFE